MKEGFSALTEKEKQTLRLIVRGHDAKSIARNLGLSVHTINERLRDARRKIAVSSSREAARLLLEAERSDPSLSAHYLLADMDFGEATIRPPDNQGITPIVGAGRSVRRLWIIGVLLMTVVIGLLALIALPQTNSALPIAAPATSAATETDPEVLSAARQWLALVDQGHWDESYRATGRSFRKLNTARTWATVSTKVRAPLGAVISRAFISQENLPAPPHGYEVVKFRTSFANKPDTVETITLDHEDGGWRVVGITIG